MNKQRIDQIAQKLWNETSQIVPMCEHHLHYAHALAESPEYLQEKEIELLRAEVKILMDALRSINTADKGSEQRRLKALAAVRGK